MIDSSFGASEGVYMLRSMDENELYAPLKCVGDPRFKMYILLLKMVCSTILPPVDSLSPPHRGLWTFKPPINRMGLGICDRMFFKIKPSNFLYRYCGWLSG